MNIVSGMYESQSNVMAATTPHIKSSNSPLDLILELAVTWHVHIVNKKPDDQQPHDVNRPLHICKQHPVSMLNMTVA